MPAIITQVVYSKPSGTWMVNFDTAYGDNEAIRVREGEAKTLLRAWPHVIKEQGNFTTYTLIQNPGLNRRSC